MGTSTLNNKTSLKSSSNLGVKIYRSISEVNEGEWDAIVGEDRIFCTYRYLKALERSGMNEGKCYYVVVYDGSKIVAHASVYSISTELDVFAQGAIKKIIGIVRRKWKNFFVLRSLECGPPIALGRVVSFKDGADRAETLGLLCQGMESIAKELGIKFLLFRDFYDDETQICGLLKERGYEKIHNLPKAEIRVRWKSFDEYLNSMRSNYRCKIVKSMDKCAKANVSIRALKNPLENSRDLKRLYDNVSHQAKEIKREQVSEIFFQDIDKYLGEEAVILAASKDEKLIGFMLALFNGKELISALLGLDYDYNREYYVYFNLFYRTIELAVEKGMGKIDMGITTLDPKKDMGSDIVALNMYMKHSNPLLNKIIPTLFDMITPPDTTGPRNVFKEK
ncbi:MAG: GNAT family N-acetyltransferase [Candidatus Omnitrophota bacterium]|nr:GNAT family N-acetyltransferase [Candidatus Omnitrophota bacterium]